MPPRKRCLNSLEDYKYDIFIQLLKGTFNVPVRDRTAGIKRALLHFWRLKSGLQLRGEELYYKGKKIMKKSDLKGKVLKELKKTMGAGARAVKHRLKEQFTGISESAISEVLQKDRNYSRLNAKFTNKPPLQTVSSSEVLERVQIDLVDMRRHAVSENGNTYNYILTFMDTFSRYIILRPVVSKRPQEIKQVIENICLEHGYPRIIQCDNGTEFRGPLPSYLASKGVKVINSSPYHPQSQGKIERSHAVLKKKLQFELLNSKRGVNWVQRLPHISFAMNTQIKEVLGYQKPASIYFGRSKESVDKAREKVQKANKRCAYRMQSKQFGSSCSIYNPKEKVLVKLHTGKGRIPKREKITVGIIRKRHRSYGKYLVSYTNLKNEHEIKWVSVKNITSITREEECRRRKQSRNIFRDKRKRKQHRERYYIMLPNSESRSMLPNGESRSDELEVDLTEPMDDDDVFIDNVRVAFNPMRFGNCQFDAVSHQLISLGIYRTGAQVRACAVAHLRHNYHYYVGFVGTREEFNNYIERMQRNSTYGDHMTLQAIAREFNLQFLVVSSLGQGYHRIISNSNRFDPDLPLLTLGHYPEEQGEHYVSVNIQEDAIENILPNELPIADSTPVIESVNQDNRHSAEDDIDTQAFQTRCCAESDEQSIDTYSVRYSSEESGEQSNESEIETLSNNNCLSNLVLRLRQTIDDLRSARSRQRNNSNNAVNAASAENVLSNEMPIADSTPVIESGTQANRHSAEADTYAQGEQSGDQSNESHSESHSNNNCLSNLVLRLRQTIDDLRSARSRQRHSSNNAVNAPSAETPLIYINPAIMEHVSSPVSIKKISMKFGTYSGLAIRLREIINNRKWKSAWIEIRERNESWYEILKIFWKQ